VEVARVSVRRRFPEQAGGRRRAARAVSSARRRPRFGHDPRTDLLNNVNLGLGSSYTIVSAPAEGDTTLYNGPAFATVRDGVSHTTSYELDERGRLLEEVKPDGATDSYDRDQAGQVTEYMDPLGYATDYTYSYSSGDGGLVQVGYADGSFDAYQYDPTFHHVTQFSNALGVLETDTYNATGDLMSSADAYGNTTRYTGLAGLMQTMSDPRGDTLGYVYDADRRWGICREGAYPAEARKNTPKIDVTPGAIRPEYFAREAAALWQNTPADQPPAICHGTWSPRRDDGLRMVNCRKGLEK
jgi:YD repeat-containing protein